VKDCRKDLGKYPSVEDRNGVAGNAGADIPHKMVLVGAFAPPHSLKAALL
jgi:hypothetical protein